MMGTQEIVENPAKGKELKLLGKEKGAYQKTEPDKHLEGPGLSDEEQNPVDEISNRQNIDRYLANEER